MPTDSSCLVDDRGQQLPLDCSILARRFGVRESSAIEHAIRCRGFVLWQPAYRAAFVELNPLTVEPLAAREAWFMIGRSRAKCLVLSVPDRRNWCKRYQVYTSHTAARTALEAIARAAGRRNAEQLECRRGRLTPSFPASCDRRPNGHSD